MGGNVWVWGGALVAFLLVAGPARAADLNVPPPAPRPSNCRIIPQPRLNLTTEDVVGADPQTVCFSRGLLADSLHPYNPPPPPRGFFDFWP